MLSSISLPSRLQRARRRVLVYFVCGNPGCIGFYADFLEALRAQLDASETHTAYDVYGRNLLGFSDAEHPPFGPRQAPWDVAGQAAALYDDVVAAGRPYAAVVLAGHSVGAYLAVDVFQRHARRPPSAPPLRLSHGLLLFPTLASLPRSPSGRRLMLLRRVPTLEAHAHTYARLALALVPTTAVLWLLRRALGFSTRTADVAAEWLASRDGVRQALHLAASELDVMGDDVWPDELWDVCADDGAPRFFLLYGRRDHWVADDVRDNFIQRRRARGPTSIAVDAGRLPHAFCTNERELLLPLLETYYC